MFRICKAIVGQAILVLAATFVVLAALPSGAALQAAPSREEILKQELEEKRKEEARLQAERDRLSEEVRRKKEQSERLKTDHERYRASLRKSFYYPGLGQWERGRQSVALGFMAGFSFLLYRTHQDYGDWTASSRRYEDVTLPLAIIGGLREPSALLAVAAVFDVRRRDVQASRAALTTSALIALAVYAWDIADMYANSPYAGTALRSGFELAVAGEPAPSVRAGSGPRFFADSGTRADLSWTLRW